MYHIATRKFYIPLEYLLALTTHNYTGLSEDKEAMLDKFLSVISQDYEKKYSEVELIWEPWYNIPSSPMKLNDVDHNKDSICQVVGLQVLVNDSHYDHCYSDPYPMAFI